MNRDQARSLVAQTFTHAFDKSRFRNFAFNLLNHVDESKAQQWNTTYVKDAFKGHVNRYERLGTYTSPEREKLDVLIVYLTTDSKLERARTAIRNFVADHLKIRDEKDAALVAFISPSETSWRFSYVKMEYAAAPTDSGKVGIETRLTPARRFSYIVGEGESCHTAQTRFLDLLSDTEEDPSLARIEDAFSVEAVTKEFFTRYRLLFEQINAALEKLVSTDDAVSSEFTKKGINTVDFAKKLMGQIVFLHFLQKKGWLGVAKGQDWGAGPHDFLRKLARREFGSYDNFFNDILEPLFYDTLATDRGHEAWCDRFKCRIPFLNGGLFEPLGDYNWRRTDIQIPNQLFTNSKPFEGDLLGTGVLDIFDRYNFTVNEAEPLEKEVAIDPEMLGKVFENLIEENRRKGMGAYYTPRDVVHYMCQQSLTNYLDTALNKETKCVPRSDIETFVHIGDQGALYEAARLSGTKSYALHLPKSIETHARDIDETLAAITICDPAVGSGAFPVGMMTEVVRARSALTPYFNDVRERTPYHFKRHAILNCLYGVDIDPGAVEIAKLRLWLSLVVDEESVTQIKPLPNLEYKVVVGDSLRMVDHADRFFKSNELKELEKLKIKIFEETDHSRKNEIKRHIEKLLNEITDGRSIFDFETSFSEVFRLKGGFDVAIANPPYIPIEEMSEQQKATYQANHPELSRKYDSAAVFILATLRILNKQGYLCFISSLTWQTGDNYGALRRKIFTDHGLIKIVNLPFDIFESAYVDTGIYLIAHRKQSAYEIIRFPKNAKELNFQAAGSCRIPYSLLRPPLYRIVLNPQVAQILGRLRANGTTVDLGSVTESTQGLAGSAFRRASGKTSMPFVEKGQVYRYQLVLESVSSVEMKDHRNLIRYYEHGPKILIRRVINRQDRLMATISDDALVFKKDVNPFWITDTRFNPRYVLGLLNSRFVSWLYVNSSAIATKDDFRQTTLSELRELPLPVVPAKQQERVVKLVDEMLRKKAKNHDEDTSRLDEQIDELVYDLYGLTREEVTAVQLNSAAALGSKVSRQSPLSA